MIAEDLCPVFFCKERPHPDGGDNEPLWRFYCDHCRRHHIHGALDGPRVAHCRPESPFHGRTYWLLPAWLIGE